ncbi:carbohydrate ABC transporter membrane protein 1 (CUT1 family) [Neobacillus bataviensis]|uniref:Carbohydrate ABC transporter membrane protein 1 (CUT1 family) n=2 Tax=Neobacillus bataviensis TaxID=220685 RepID=A0A561DNG8_9BACI|nr:carbohydrate ABC transporter membrane protein 1 (CUT1 family) [Neobacillus bataviensis]
MKNSALKVEIDDYKTSVRKTSITPKKKRKKLFTEKTAGYYLVAPAMILIFLIAIWPVLQSFYFSLFDLRLNNPTKSEVHLSYNLDLERYLNNYPFLIGTIDNEIKSGNGAEELQPIKDQLQSIDKMIRSRSEISTKYDSVNDKLMNFEQVNSELSIAKIDKKMAKEYENTSEIINNKMKKLSGNVKFTQEKKLLGLAAGYGDALIQPNFIGLQHYKDNLTASRMWNAIGNTTTFTIISVFVELILGLAIALLINKAFIGRGLIRASILIPWAIPTAVSALMWKFLYDGQNGIVAKIFADIGLVDKMEKLLVTDTGAMFSVIFSDVWKTTPYMSLLLLAGLQTIPDSLYEAASIDGAGKWKQFIKITLPLLKSSILVALLFRTLDAFRVFDLIYVLTGGGPANSTETISILAYKVMFSQTNFGDGSALSVIVFICVAIISMIYIKFLGRDLLNDR